MCFMKIGVSIEDIPPLIERVPSTPVLDGSESTEGSPYTWSRVSFNWSQFFLDIKISQPHDKKGLRSYGEVKANLILWLMETLVIYKEGNSVFSVWLQCGHDLHTLKNSKPHCYASTKLRIQRGYPQLAISFHYHLGKCLPWSWPFIVKSHPHSYSLKARNWTNYHPLTSCSNFSSSPLHFHIFSLVP